jgi:hypothetical protein
VLTLDGDGILMEPSIYSRRNYGKNSPGDEE